MQHPRSLFSATVIMFLLICSLGAGAAQSQFPLEIIRTSVQSLLAVLQDPRLQGADHRRQRLAKAEQIILPRIAVEEFARGALGRYWNQRTPAEQREFVHLFTALVLHAYADEIDQHSQGVKVAYVKQRLDGDYAEVDTQIFTPTQPDAIPVNYFMHQVNGQWLIYDVQIENVSLVLNYRSQFGHVLMKSSYADLVQTLKAKLRSFGG